MAQVSSKKTKATQEFVPLQEVKEGIAILKDGSLRSIIMASSLNFSLKSDDERTAILLQFQDFVNSLDFSIQIFIQSRRLDIRPYIATLEEQEKVQMQDLMKIQTREYIEFIKNFTDNSNIMTKTFFVVVPYAPSLLQKGSGLGLLTGGSTSKKIDQQSFEEHRMQLEQRLAVVEQGLVRTGVRVVKLGTEEIIELFYKIFNPGDAAKPIQL